MQFKEFTLTLIKNEEKIIEENFINLASNNSVKINLLDYTTILDIDTEEFIRENADFLFKIDIKNKKCTVNLKQENIELPILVDYLDYSITPNQIILEYVIESEDAKNKLIITKKDDIYE